MVIQLDLSLKTHEVEAFTRILNKLLFSMPSLASKNMILNVFRKKYKNVCSHLVLITFPSVSSKSSYVDKLNSYFFPCCKFAYIQPVPKKGNRSNPSGFDFPLSKVFEAVLTRKILAHTNL